MKPTSPLARAFFWPLLCAAAGIVTLELPSLSFPSLHAAPAPASPAPAAQQPERRISLNDNWRFVKGDPEGADTDKILSYKQLKDPMLAIAEGKAKPGEFADIGKDVTYTQATFNDASWRSLSLPHDWGIEGPFDIKHPGETGKLPWWGIAWYRRTFELPAKPADRQIYLDVDGAMSLASVWINGKYVGGWAYGYASWRVDLTPYVKFGAENTIAIRIDNAKESSRWYPGGGIYRNVWLINTAPVHVAHWGTSVTTPEITADAAKVNIATTVSNKSDAEATVSVQHEIYELDSKGKATGKPVATSAPASVTSPAGQQATIAEDLTVAKPKLWDIEAPNRYIITTVLMQNGKEVDRYDTPFGIRNAKFTADDGFHLNGKRVRLNGVCNHHDLGALGAAFNYRAAERQIELLKEMGFNALRTSHNPPAPELLEICDRLGVVVMDEFSDTWGAPKKANGYSRFFKDWSELDLTSFIRRDRNHPSIIMWSTGNEIYEQAPWGHAVSQRLTDIVHRTDPTRPVTVGANYNDSATNGFAKTVDVFGFNYKPGLYGKVHAENPTLPLYGSETASCISSRGVYAFPVSNGRGDGKAGFQMSSYDLYAPGWASEPDLEFAGQDKNPFVAGEFVWTGFDYLGEPTPFNSDLTIVQNFNDPAERAKAEKELKEAGKIATPARSSYFGIIDLAGLKKDRFYIYQARWRPELPMVHMLPHWTWPGREGEVTPVHVYTSGDEAELFINGKSQGRKKKEPLKYRIRWNEVKYEPGEVKVVAYKDGKQWAETTMFTAGAPANVRAVADRSVLAADGKDLSFVTVDLTDSRGTFVPTASNVVKFALTGPAEIVATDNGDATSLESFQLPDRKLFSGKCIAIIRTRKGEAGPITVTASVDGLPSATVKLQSQSEPAATK